VHHPLESSRDPVVDEPQFIHTCATMVESTLGTYLVNPPTSMARVNQHPHWYLFLFE